jgi:hypothetical protein
VYETHPRPYGPPQPAPTPGLGESPTDALHWVVPLGRTWQSVVASWLGALSIVIWLLGPVAFAMGTWALHDAASNGGRGRGRAAFAVAAGALSTLAMTAFMVGTDA